MEKQLPRTTIMAKQQLRKKQQQQYKSDMFSFPWLADDPQEMKHVVLMK